MFSSYEAMKSRTRRRFLLLVHEASHSKMNPSVLILQLGEEGLVEEVVRGERRRQVRRVSESVGSIEPVESSGNIRKSERSFTSHLNYFHFILEMSECLTLFILFIIMLSRQPRVNRQTCSDKWKRKNKWRRKGFKCQDKE